MRQPEQGGNRWGGGYMLAATCYVNDVLPDGGAFAYWPKSHRAVHNYFRRNPLGLDGQYIQWPDVQEQGHRALWGSDPTTEVSPHPAIWAASEGDVCFWHGQIVHGSSPNLREPRLALFGRWAHKEMRVDGEWIHFGEGPEQKGATFLPPDDPGRGHLRYDVPEDPWRHWGRALREAGGSKL